MPHIDTRIAVPPSIEGALDHLRGLDADARFALEPEQGNPFDDHAVRVMHDGVHVGYVPKAVSPEIRSLLDAGRVTGVTKRSTAAITIHVAEKE